MDISAQILLRNYMLERLLERVSLSEFRDKFILKGGMLIASIVGVDLRSTIDMDVTIKSYPVTFDTIQSVLDSILSVQIDDRVDIRLIKIEEIRAEDELTEVLNDILAEPIDDGVSMTLKKLEFIRNESDYPGIRVSISAILDKTKQTMKECATNYLGLVIVLIVKS